MTTECPVCFDTYQNEGEQCPKLLPCSHTVCLNCLGQLARNGNSHVRCPECRELNLFPQGGAGAFRSQPVRLGNFTTKGENRSITKITGSTKPRYDCVYYICILQTAEYAYGYNDMLRDIIIHGISAETDIDAGIRVGTSEARNNRSTVEERGRGSVSCMERFFLSKIIIIFIILIMPIIGLMLGILFYFIFYL